MDAADLFCKAAQYECESYWTTPYEIALLGTLEAKPDGFVDVNSGFYYGFWETWRRGRAHRMLPFRRLTQVEAGEQYVGMEGPFDFLYDLRQLAGTCRAHRSAKNLPLGQLNVFQPKPEQLAQIVQQNGLEYQGMDDDKAAWTERMMELVEVSQRYPASTWFEYWLEGERIGFIGGWQTGERVYLPIRQTLGEYRPYSRLILADVADWYAARGARWEGDGDAYEMPGLFRFKQSLQPATYDTFFWTHSGPTNLHLML